VTCDSYHSTPQAPDCPFCVIVALTLALEKLDPHAAALTPAMELLRRTQRERALARKAAR
jgi:hypothetical protein